MVTIHKKNNSIVGPHLRTIIETPTCNNMPSAVSIAKRAGQQAINSSSH